MDTQILIIIVIILLLSFLEYKKRNIKGYHVAGTCIASQHVRTGRFYSGTYLVSGQAC